MEFFIKPRQAAIALSSIIGFLIFTNTVALYLEFGLDHDYAFGLVPMFKLTQEGNIPTLFASIIWLVTSLLLGIISLMVYKKKSAYLKHWIGLSLLTFYLALDETAQIHEMFDHNLGWTDGFFSPEDAPIAHGYWVVVYGSLGLIFIISYLKFYISLSNRYKILFGSAGVIFVAGAAGLELIGAQIWTEVGGNSLLFEIINSIEEVMEKTGVTIAIYGLLLYIKEFYGSLKVSIGGQGTEL